MIGDVIREAVERKNITIGEAAELCNITRPHFHDWLKSERILPKNFPIISKALGVPRRRLEKANRSR